MGADGFVARLKAKTGLDEFGLPALAQWEIAARAGTDTFYYWGDAADEDKALEYAWFGAAARGARAFRAASRPRRSTGFRSAAVPAMSAFASRKSGQDLKHFGWHLRFRSPKPSKLVLVHSSKWAQSRFEHQPCLNPAVSPRIMI